jgi:hypothetical protein
MEHIEKYAEIMEEIKKRFEVIDLYLAGQLNSLYLPTTIETIGLQFRKIFESIAFASLAAHKTQYSAAYTNFSKHWEAAKLLNNLARINPDFYPKPILEERFEQSSMDGRWVDREGDYLTKTELIICHGKCGSLMHSANPFRRPIDYSTYQGIFSTWRLRTMNLLNSHIVRLVGDHGLYLFHMREEGQSHVRWYRFEPGDSDAIKKAQRRGLLKVRAAD